MLIDVRSDSMSDGVAIVILVYIVIWSIIFLHYVSSIEVEIKMLRNDIKEVADLLRKIYIKMETS